METNWWKIALIALIAAALFGLGYYLGWKKDPEVIIKEKIKYVELDPVHDTIPKPVPYKVVEPVDTANVILACIEQGIYNELFPENHKTDTVFVSQEDTSAVIKDWGTKRLYSETLFDSDTLGKFTLDATVQYNRLSDLGYNYVPVQKQTETTIRTMRKFLPYIGAGFDTDWAITGQAGMFFHQDAGFAIQYRYNTQTKTNTLGGLFLYMF